jgi:NAD(P)-dependent dehydrogenase (short-subunit alcohol dehydrogenase family)
MSQKVALVTGANKGIGYETAKQLAKEGVTVIAAARNEAKGKAAAEELKQQGLKVEFLNSMLIMMQTLMQHMITSTINMVNLIFSSTTPAYRLKAIAGLRTLQQILASKF